MNTVADRLEMSAETMAAGTEVTFKVLGSQAMYSFKDPVSYAEAKAALDAASLPMIKAPSPATAAVRAIEWARVKKLIPKLVRRFTQDDGTPAWALVQQDKVSGNRLEFEHEQTITLVNGDLIVPSGYEQIIDQFSYYLGNLLGTDLSAYTKALMATELHGQPLWPDGNVWFIPPSKRDLLLVLRNTMRLLAGPSQKSVFNAMLILDEPESRGDTIHKVMAELELEIKEKYEELKELIQDPGTRSQTFTRRLFEVELLSAKLSEYTATFGVAGGTLQKWVDVLSRLTSTAISNRSKE